MRKITIKIKDAAAASMIKNGMEDKEAIKAYFQTGDKSEIEKRNIRFVKPI